MCSSDLGGTVRKGEAASIAFCPFTPVVCEHLGFSASAGPGPGGAAVRVGFRYSGHSTCPPVPAQPTRSDPWAAPEGAREDNKNLETMPAPVPERDRRSVTVSSSVMGFTDS